MVQDVAAAEVDELDHAERREAQPQSVARGLVDFLGGGGALLDHAGRLVHHQRLQARHDVARRCAADHGQLADLFHQRLGAREHGGIGAGVAAELHHRDHIGRIEPVHVEKAPGQAHQRRELRHEDAAGGRGQDGVVAAMAVELFESLALGFHGLGHAFEHQFGGGERLRCRCGIDEAHAFGNGLALLRIDHAELRQPRKAGFDLGLGFGLQALPGFVPALAQVDQRDPVARIGEGDGDAAPHSAGADGGEPRQRLLIRHRAAFA